MSGNFKGRQMGAKAMRAARNGVTSKAPSRAEETTSLTPRVHRALPLAYYRR